MTLPHSLVGIYDNDTRVYRYRDTSALVMLGGSTMIIRPWLWSGVSYRDECDEANPDFCERVEALLESPIVAHGRVEFGELLIWASKRPRWDTHTLHPCDEPEVPFEIRRYTVDTQPVCGDAATCLAAVNRVLLRDAMQVFVEQRLRPDIGIALRLVEHRGGHALILMQDTTSIAVMSMRGGEGLEIGNDRFPGVWYRNKGKGNGNG